jgi:heme-degrading monooxygenase HmoA
MRSKSYVAVIFTSQLAPDSSGYADMAQQMESLAAHQVGYLGFESARNADGFGISVSYWEDEAAAHAWKLHADHLRAQDAGRAAWYDVYRVQIATVNSSYGNVPRHDATASDGETDLR